MAFVKDTVDDDKANAAREDGALADVQHFHIGRHDDVLLRFWPLH